VQLVSKISNLWSWSSNVSSSFLQTLRHTINNPTTCSPSITPHLSAVNHFLTAAQQLLSSKPTINHDLSSFINPSPHYTTAVIATCLQSITPQLPRDGSYRISNVTHSGCMPSPVASLQPQHRGLMLPLANILCWLSVSHILLIACFVLAAHESSTLQSVVLPIWTFNVYILSFTSYRVNVCLWKK